MASQMALRPLVEQIAREKGITAEDVVLALKLAMESAYKREYNTEMDPRIGVDLDDTASPFEMLIPKQVVERVDDPLVEISLKEAQQYDKYTEFGKFVEIPLPIEELGRIGAQAAKQVMMQKIMDVHRAKVCEEYEEKVGRLVVGRVRRQDASQVYVELDKIEAILPKSQQVPGEQYHKKSRIRAIVLEVRQSSGGPLVILSRSHTDFVRRLFEIEVPEIQEGTVEIVRLVREPGSRTKMAVFSYSEDVDAVGACVGTHGNRVQAVVDELRGEKIDIIHWAEDPKEFIPHALLPARVKGVNIKEDFDARHQEDRVFAEVIVSPDMASLAIGKEGQNVRLAAKLTNWRIDIVTEEQKLMQVTSFDFLDKDAQRDRNRDELNEVTLEKLEIPEAAITALGEWGVATAGDLLGMTEEDLLAVEEITEDAVAAIQEWLKGKGFKLGEEAVD